MKDKEFVTIGTVFGRGVWGEKRKSQSLTSEGRAGGEMPRPLRIRQPGSFVGWGEGRRAGRKQLWSENCPRPGASGEVFLLGP